MASGASTTALGVTAQTQDHLPTVYQGSARSLLLTILGEFVMPTGDPVWTSSILEVMTGLDVEPQTARQAISRAAASGWIEGERRGREVRWKLTAHGRSTLETGERRVYSLASPTPWDGSWLIVLLTIPQSKRTSRKKVYAALGRRGFGNPTAGIWLSPHPDRQQDLASVIERYELTDSTLTFMGRSVDVGLDDRTIADRAWKLEPVAAHYASLLERFSGLDPRPGEDSLHAHLRLVNALQHLPLIDPQLPQALLPDWIGRDATRTFTRLRSAWQAQSRARWDAINRTRTEQ